LDGRGCRTSEFLQVDGHNAFVISQLTLKSLNRDDPCRCEDSVRVDVLSQRYSGRQLSFIFANRKL
jgi:hypothetical protein